MPSQNLPLTWYENETINALTVAWNIPDYEQYKIRKPAAAPLVNKYIDIHRDLLEKHTA